MLWRGLSIKFPLTSLRWVTASPQKNPHPPLFLFLFLAWLPCQKARSSSLMRISLNPGTTFPQKNNGCLKLLENPIHNLVAYKSCFRISSFSESSSSYLTSRAASHSCHKEIILFFLEKVPGLVHCSPDKCPPGPRGNLLFWFFKQLRSIKDTTSLRLCLCFSVELHPKHWPGLSGQAHKRCFRRADLTKVKIVCTLIWEEVPQNSVELPLKLHRVNMHKTGLSKGTYQVCHFCLNLDNPLFWDSVEPLQYSEVPL